MQQSLISKFSYMLRSRIRFVRYRRAMRNQTVTNPLFNLNQHPVTLGPEQISHFFTYIANHERSRY